MMYVDAACVDMKVALSSEHRYAFHVMPLPYVCTYLPRVSLCPPSSNMHTHVLAFKATRRHITPPNHT